MSVDPIVEKIEADAARQAKAARIGYAAEMKVVRTDFMAKQREIAKRERDELKRIERWRLTSVAAVEGRPVPFDDIRSVKAEEIEKGAHGVSVPKLRCIK